MSDENPYRSAAPVPNRSTHEFDGVQAVGSWIIAELKGESTRTGSGAIVLPQGSGIKSWVVVSVGPESNRVCSPGDRVFIKTWAPQSSLDEGPVPTIELDGRTYALIRPGQIVAVLHNEPASIVTPNERELRIVS